MDLLYPEALVRELVRREDREGGARLAERARGAGTCERHLGAALRGGRRAAGRAAPSRRRSAPGRGAVVRRGARSCSQRRAARRCSWAARLSRARPRRDRLAAPCAALGVPVYLSGMARGLLGADAPAAAAPQAEGGAARGRPRDPGGRAVRLPARLRRAHRPRRAPRLGEPRAATSCAKNRRPTLAALGAPEPSCARSPARRRGPRPQLGGLARGAPRARRGARRGDRARRPRPRRRAA